jgi:hypothetical protein
MNDQNLKISFDFDGTLDRNDFIYLIAQTLKMAGHQICVLTSRDTNWDNRDLIKRISGLGLTLEDVIFVPNTWKWQAIQEHQIDFHFDDDPQEINKINKYCTSEIFNTAGFLVSFDIPFTLNLLTQKHFKDGC